MTMATRVMDTHRVVADVGMAAVAIVEEDSVDVAVAMADADVLTTPLVGMSRIKRLEKVTQRKPPKVLPTTLLLLCKLVMAASAVVDFAEEEAVVEEGEEETPYGVSDEEFEYFNEIFEDDDIDIESLKLDDSEDLNFKKLFTDLESNLQFKIAVMKNSAVLKEMILNRKRELDEIGEAVSDE